MFILNCVRWFMFITKLVKQTIIALWDKNIYNEMFTMYSCLPEGYVYTNFSEKKALKEEQFYCDTLTTEAEIKKWVKKFGENANIEWRIARTFPQLQHMKCSYKIAYRCRYSKSSHKLKCSNNRESKSTDCPAQLIIRRIGEKERKSTVIMLKYKHNHHIGEIAALLKLQDGSRKTEDAISDDSSSSAHGEDCFMSGTEEQYEEKEQLLQSISQMSRECGTKKQVLDEPLVNISTLNNDSKTFVCSYETHEPNTSFSDVQTPNNTRKKLRKESTIKSSLLKYLNSRQEEENSLKKKELHIEEAKLDVEKKKLELEERRIKLQEDKWKMEERERQARLDADIAERKQRLAMELEERTHRLQQTEQQQKLMEMMFQFFSKNNVCMTK